MTSLLLGPPGGAQTPRVCSFPPAVSSLGAETCEFAASLGLELDPWQRFVVEHASGLRSDGRWSAFEVGLLVARQNGKGAVIEAMELAGLFLFGDRLILHSAHEFKTAAEAFLRVKERVDGSDELRRRVKMIRTSHGDEGVELLSGARLRFVARSRSSGRGFSADRTFLDEVQELPGPAIGALFPTLSARPNPQVMYTGTVPAPGNDSEHWQSVRDRGRAGGDPSLAWFEWSPGGDRVDLADPVAWAEANPALGIRITEETIAREFRAMGADEFGRERVTIWQDTGYLSLIDPDEWAGMVDPSSTPVDPVALSIAVSHERVAYIGVAGLRADGLVHVDYGHDERRGLSWVAGKVAEIVGKRRPCAVVLDPAGPAGALIPDLVKAGVDVTSVSSRDLAQACGMFFDAASEGRLRHLGQAPLAVALDRARTRKVGDAWVWDRPEPSVDVTPLFAVTLALFGYVKFGQTKPKTFQVYEF